MLFCHRKRRIPRHDKVPSQWAGRWDALLIQEAEQNSETAYLLGSKNNQRHLKESLLEATGKKTLRVHVGK